MTWPWSRSVVEVRIVGGQALDPGKVYLLELDRLLSMAVHEALLAALRRYGITVIAIRTPGGHAVRVVELEKET